MTTKEKSCCPTMPTSPIRRRLFFPSFSGRIAGLLAGIVAAAIAALGSIPSARAQESDNYYREMARGLELFGEVYREIVERYAGRIDPEALAETAINGMLSKLDRHSVYVSPDAGENTSRRSLRVGIGIEVDTLDEILTVTEVLEGYAARNAGVRIGDRVIAVNGNHFLHNNPEELYAALRGEVGSQLTLTITRDGVEGKKDFTMVRERIRVPSLRYAGIINDSILFMRLERFGENAGNEFRTELLRVLQYEKTAGKIGGIILDLRGNPGGILEEGVRVAEAFVPQGKLIVATEGRDTVEHEILNSERDPVAQGIPLILLVDEKTASAGELLTAAIQDYDLGVIVGRPTIGKGVVQSVRSLPFGASIRLTTAWYVAPSGRSIQRMEELAMKNNAGIIPDTLLGVFRTENGRLMESGKGIIPDTIMPTLPAESIITRLEKIGAFFHFASLYTAPLDSLPADFRLSSGTIPAFEEYALARLLDYEEGSGAIATLDSLQETLSGIHNEKRINRLFDDLSRAIIMEDEKDFADAREEIYRRLEREIIGRFQSRGDQIKTGLADDPQVQLGLTLLRNRTQYKRLLGTE